MNIFRRPDGRGADSGIGADKSDRIEKSSSIDTMKAVRIHSYGGPEVLKYEDAPRPKPGPGEVLVKVYAAGVNPVDWKIREGYRKIHTLPLILGWDFSGVTESIGQDVAGWKKGDGVYSRPDLARDGAYAEYIVVRASEIASKPKSIDHIKAAAIPLAALTAWQTLFDTGGLSAGQKVLIHAAAGGVGHIAVQLAKWKGAYVIGTASERNLKFLHELGADETVDYQKTRFEDVVHDVDMVLDTIGDDTQKRSWQVLKKDGILVSIIRKPTDEEPASYGVRGGYVFVQPNGKQLAEITKLVDSGKLKPIVETVLALPDARRAQELSQTKHARGKIVLKIV